VYVIYTLSGQALRRNILYVFSMNIVGAILMILAIFKEYKPLRPDILNDISGGDLDEQINFIEGGGLLVQDFGHFFMIF